MKVKERLIIKTFKYKKTQGFGVLLEEKIGEKREYWAGSSKKKRGVEIVISQLIRIFSLPWYGVSNMHIKILDFIVKFHYFL